MHRLLGYMPAVDRYRHHENHPLPADVVVIDEASMIDLAMMDRLVAAVAPGARLILLGDADQLPSVDAGSILRDLTLAGGGELACRLTRSHRMDPRDPAGRAILSAAIEVNAGKADALLAARASQGDGDYDAPLARVEGAIALGRLAQRFPKAELANGAPQYRENIVLRGLAALPVGLGGA